MAQNIETFRTIHRDPIHGAILTQRAIEVDRDPIHLGRDDAAVYSKGKRQLLDSETPENLENFSPGQSDLDILHAMAVGCFHLVQKW